MEMMFVEARYKDAVGDALLGRIREAIKPFKKINLVSSIQYLNQMNWVRENVKDKEFVIKQSRYRAMYPGQILGCDVYAADCEDCDATLSFTQGIFHVLGIPIKFGKSVINVDVESEEITEISGERADTYRKKIMQAIGIALSAKRVMFVESTKSGQTYGAKLLKEAFKLRGAAVYSILFDEINFSRLNELRDVDIFINTACQRIAIDDMEKIEKPIVNAEDLEPYLLK
jgi:2-(3-amino-3-carboxypropyl)histidine synthase